MRRDVAIAAIVGAALVLCACAAQADKRPPQTHAPAPARSAAADEAFLAARKAYLQADLVRLESAARAAAGHPLGDYLVYWRLSLRLRAGPPAPQDLDAELMPVLAQQDGTAIGELLRRDWLLNLGRRGEWSAFDQQYPRLESREDAALQCLAWQSMLARASVAPAAELERVLMAPRELPDVCNRLIDQLLAQRKLPADTSFRRLLRAIESGSVPAMRTAALALGVESHALEDALGKATVHAAHGSRREVVLIALARMARNDPAHVAAQLDSSGLPALKPADRAFLWAQVAAAGMRRLAPESLAWTQRGVDAPVSDESLVWMARAALRAQQWRLLGTLIDRMSAESRQDPAWVYWRARAFTHENRRDQALPLLQSIAGDFHFYGQLAGEDLGRLTVLPAPAPRPTEGEIAAAGLNEGFARALRFYELGLRPEGNREWNHQLRNMDDRQLLAAAAWACERRILDRCVNTADRTRHEHDFGLRFVTPFRDQVQRAASDRGIDPAWVYGLIRQESRFIMDARSSAGAQGLMQIMPNTAKWIARKLEVRDFRVEQLGDMQTNISFGTYYLKSVLEDLEGSPVLASAGYNAGPGRPRMWRTTLPEPVEGAIFAEIIPFHETRDYVKKVLSNATFYAAQFSGQPQSLRAWLGQISPRPASSTALP